MRDPKRTGQLVDVYRLREEQAEVAVSTAGPSAISQTRGGVAAPPAALPAIDPSWLMRPT